MEFGEYGDDPVQFRRRLRVLKGKVKRVIGLDVDPHAANNPFVDEFHRIDDGAPWPIKSDSIDLVLCDNVLEHLERPDWFFAEAHRVLVRKGYLCIRTPNVLSYVGLISRLVPNRWHPAVLRIAQPGRGQSFPTAYRCNTVWRLRRALARHGFDGVVYGYEAEPSYLGFSQLAYRLGVWHQRLAPSCFRLALFCFAQANK